MTQSEKLETVFLLSTVKRDPVREVRFLISLGNSLNFFQILLQPLTKVVYSTARIIFTFIVFLSSNRIKTLFLLKDRRERALQAVILTEFSLRRLSNLSNRFQCN